MLEILPRILKISASGPVWVDFWVDWQGGWVSRSFGLVVLLFVNILEVVWTRMVGRAKSYCVLKTATRNSANYGRILIKNCFDENSVLT